MGAATGQARNRAADSADTRENLFAVGTFVEEPPNTLGHWKGKSVATLLIADSKIDTGATPFLTVRQNSATSAAELRQQMRQLMAKCALDFWRMFAQPGIQRDQLCAKVRAARASLQTTIPFHPDRGVDPAVAQELVCFRFKIDIAPKRLCRSRKNQFELLRPPRNRCFFSA